MRTIFFFFTLTLAAQTPESLWRAARSRQPAPEAQQPPQLLQVSTLDALLRGLYAASYTVGELKQQGDFGVGTYEGLDGELIALDGRFYQMRANGQLTEATDKDRIPFAALVKFKADVQFSARNVTQAQLGELIDSLIPTKNHFYAIKVHGTFRDLTTRAIAKQVLPYPPLADLIPGQSVFNYANIAGTAVGIRSPSFVAGINQVGHHFHFVSDDQKSGGHALAFTTGDVTLEIQQLRRHAIWLPDDEPFRKAVLPVQ
jgi:acetolactate decarboxylase